MYKGYHDRKNHDEVAAPKKYMQDASSLQKLPVTCKSTYDRKKVQVESKFPLPEIEESRQSEKSQAS